MDLLIQLGVNNTLGLQLVMFLITFVVLKNVLFEPYYAAFNERKERTEGKTELAERFVAEAHELEQRYGARAQEVNDKFRAVYDQSRAEALKEYDRLVNEARTKTKGTIEESNRKIEKEMIAAREKLSSETAGVSQLMVQKLIGKDLSA
jgi:F0F1-type ATP synthase membrane subunit b/b'